MVEIVPSQPPTYTCPRKPPWLSTFESETAAIPNGKHNDQVNSLTLFLRATDFGRGSCDMFLFADEGEGNTTSDASNFRWTSRPKEALL